MPMQNGAPRGAAWLWQAVLLPFGLSRLLLLMVGWAAIQLRPMAQNPLPWQAAPWPLLDMWARWASGFYLDIAAHGYSYAAGQMSNVAFFPFFPMLMRGLTAGSGSPATLSVAGWLIANGALLVALVCLYQLTALDYGPTVAGRATWLLALFPTSFFLSAIYSEGLFLGLTVASFYCVRRGWWAAAGVLGALSAATRVLGLLLLLPLAYEWWQQRAKAPYGWLAFLLIPTGLLAFMLFLTYRFGDPLLFSVAHGAWGRSASVGEAAVRLQSLLHGADLGPRLLRVMVELLFTALACGLLTLMLRGHRPSYLLYAGYAIIVPLLTLQVLSMPRLVVIVFPFMIALARWLQRPAWFATVAAAMLVAQLVLFARWSLWYWVA